MCTLPSLLVHTCPPIHPSPLKFALFVMEGGDALVRAGKREEVSIEER